MSSSRFELTDVYCKYCRGVFKGTLTTHEQTCPLRKLRAIEQAAISIGDAELKCLYCNKVQEVSHEDGCKERIPLLLKMLLSGTCSEWMKGYIMTALVDFKPTAVTDREEDHGALINAILTAAKHD